MAAFWSMSKEGMQEQPLGVMDAQRLRVWPVPRQCCCVYTPTDAAVGALTVVSRYKSKQCPSEHEARSASGLARRVDDAVRLPLE